MELYKTHGINPVGGCLPLLVQLPVFYGLYNVLMNTIALRKEPFAIIAPTLPNGRPAQGHLSLSDPSGDSAIFEYVGGKLVIQLYNSTPDDGLAEGDVSVSTDGVRRTVPAGGKVVLEPGESITLPARLYHAFWAEGERA